MADAPASSGGGGGGGVASKRSGRACKAGCQSANPSRHKSAEGANFPSRASWRRVSSLASKRSVPSGEQCHIMPRSVRGAGARLNPQKRAKPSNSVKIARWHPPLLRFSPRGWLFPPRFRGVRRFIACGSGCHSPPVPASCRCPALAWFLADGIIETCLANAGRAARHGARMRRPPFAPPQSPRR